MPFISTVHYRQFVGLISGKTKSKSSVHQKTQRSVSEKKVPRSSTGQVASRAFTFRELAAATKNFTAELFLGEGGFGQVYKGIVKGDQVGSPVYEIHY